MTVLTDAGREYLARHAIDPLVLAQLGVTERGGRLILPNGRSTGLNGGAKVLQPAGTPLALWWPTGRPEDGETVLVCEGESDALSALSAIGLSEIQHAGGPDDPLAGITVAAMPGAGYPAHRLAEDLLGSGVAILAYDGDQAGREATVRSAAALHAVGIPCHDLALPDGRDVADCLAALDPALRVPWLAGQLSDARLVEKEFGTLEGATHASVAPLRPVPYTRDSRNIRNIRNIGSLLRDIKRHMSRYVVLPGTHEEVALALFVAHTWAFDGAHCTPYVVLQSPEKQSGKTRVLEVIGVLVRAPLQVASASEAALFRQIEQVRCTLMLDEVDAVFAQNSERTEALRGLINSGNRASGSAIRCVGPLSEPKVFSTFCPKILAGIDEGRLPDTIIDRAIEIRMKRKLPGERVDRFRDRTARQDVAPLLEELQQWATTAEDDLLEAEPEVPDELDDRSAEAWEPLFAIADMAGGEWPALAREAAKHLSGRREDDDAGSVGRRLLAAVRSVWPAGDADRLASVDLCRRLNGEEELPYSGWSDGKGINPGSLARYIKPYGISSETLRIGTSTPKGYRRGRFQEAWERYLPPNVAGVADVAANTDKGVGGVA